MSKLDNKILSNHIWNFLIILIPIYFGVNSYIYSTSSSYIIQDDARQHIVWMEYFTNSDLFRNDFIASYYQKTFAPTGYKFIYYIANICGINPLIFAKILPTFLGIFTSIYFFKTCLKIFPFRSAAFLSVLILNENFWMNSDLISSTPRAFIYPIFSGFLYYTYSEKYFYSIIFIVLQSLFYPLFVLIELGILCFRLLEFKSRRILLTKNKYRYICVIFGLTITCIIFLQSFANPSIYGPTVNHLDMNLMPEFYPGGRTQYYNNSLIDFLLYGRSGINFPIHPYAIWAGFLLIFFRINLFNIDYKNKISATLYEILIPSIILYLVAHFVVMKLYLPSRYTSYSLVFILSISSGIILFYILYLIIQKLKYKSANFYSKIILYISILSILYLLLIPMNPKNFIDKQNWVFGENDSIYKFLSHQDTNIIIASTSPEVDNIPAFSLRSVWVGRQFAQPYHLGYYTQFRKRMIDLLNAQYTSNPSELSHFIHSSSIDYWLLDLNAFSENYFSIKENKWLNQYHYEIDTITQHLKQRDESALYKLTDPCTVVKSSTHRLIETQCILRKIDESSRN